MTTTVLVTGWNDKDGASYDVIVENEGFSNRKNRHTTEHYGNSRGELYEGAAYEFYLHEPTGEQFLMLNAGYVYDARAELDGVEQRMLFDARTQSASIRVPEGYVMEDVSEADAETLDRITMKDVIESAAAGSTGDDEDDPKGSAVATDAADEEE